MQFGMYREVPSRHMTSLKANVLKNSVLQVHVSLVGRKKQFSESEFNKCLTLMFIQIFSSLQLDFTCFLYDFTCSYRAAC